jgi:hypothetical protein
MSLILALQPASTTPESVIATVNNFADFLLTYVGALAAVGALSMALIEGWKKLRDSRTRFHALRWTEWVQSSPFADNLRPTSDKRSGVEEIVPPPSLVVAYGDLIHLCTGVPLQVALDSAKELLATKGRLKGRRVFLRSGPPEHALFALDLGRMMGSIQEAADLALSSPRQHVGLYLLMTSGADREDIVSWHQEGPEGMIAIAEPDAEDRRSIKEHADLFARLRQVVKRKLDGFQLYAGDQWAIWNQTVANVVGIVVLFLVLLWVRFHSPNESPGYLTIVVLSLFGGILSPIAKDLVSALKRVKDG